MKKYETYKSSGIDWLGEIPSHWGCENLKRITKFAYGESLSEKNRNGGEVPVYGSNGIVGFHDKAITRSPCIIVGRKGSYGKINYSEKACFPIDTSYFIDSTQTRCNLQWLMYFLSILKLDENTLDDTVPGLSRQWVYKMPGLIVPLSEQESIVRFLNCKTGEIDSFINKRQKQIELLREQKACIINKAVTNGVNTEIKKIKMKPSGIDWIGEIPEHWEIWKVSRLFKEIGSGTTPKAGTPEYYEDGTVPWINTGDLNDGILEGCETYITEKAFAEHSTLKLYKKGSLIIAMYGATIGKLAILDFEACTNQACCVLADSKLISIEFAFYWFLSQKQNIINMSYGGGQPNISQDIIRSIRIPIPSIEEQQSIINFIKEETLNIDILIIKYQKQIDLMKEYRASLISQVITGNFDVREWQPKKGEVL
jgi:type I restriction enzyme, S subunit